MTAGPSAASDTTELGSSEPNSIEANAPSSASGLGKSELLRLQRRSDAKGLTRLLGHLLAIAASVSLYTFAMQRGWHWAVVGLCLAAYGFTLVTCFAAMHECVHRTAFKSHSLNDTVGWFAGLLSFYNSTYYRPYHAWHHRYTQIPGKDPELEDPKPADWSSYLIELSGVTWWLGKLGTYAKLGRGKVSGYPFLNEQNARAVVRSVRLQLAAYGAAIAVSVGLGQAYFVSYWLLPVALAQPLLRAILLAEHTGCTLDDNALTNTRTTHTLMPIRYLMWEMPYHAEHHRHPALPFFALGEAHVTLRPHLSHVADRGYGGMHRELLRTFKSKSQSQSATRVQPNHEPRH
jgi:fatty acid desaturase